MPSTRNLAEARGYPCSVTSYSTSQRKRSGKMEQEIASLAFIPKQLHQETSKNIPTRTLAQRALYTSTALPSRVL